MGDKREVMSCENGHIVKEEGHDKLEQPNSKEVVSRTFGDDEKFLKGIALSVFQNSGDNNTSNWSHFIKNGVTLMGQSKVKNASDITIASDFWNRLSVILYIIK